MKYSDHQTKYIRK